MLQRYDYSKFNKGMHTQNLVAYAFFPLKMISPRAEQIYEAAKDDIKKRQDTLPAARREQYQFHLDRVKYGRPGLELLSFPGHITSPSEFLCYNQVMSEFEPTLF